MLLFWAISLAVCKLALNIPIPKAAQFYPVICASVWLYLPFLPMWLNNMDRLSVGATLKNHKLILKSLALALLVTFVPFYLIMILGGHFGLDKPIALSLPKEILPFSINQLILVALPEEFFFRGYVQSRLNSGFKWKMKIFGAEIGVGVIGGAILFALAHIIVSATPLRAATVFPALVMGWLREKTGSLAAPMAYHWLANITFLFAAQLFRQ